MQMRVRAASLAVNGNDRAVPIGAQEVLRAFAWAIVIAAYVSNDGPQRKVRPRRASATVARGE
jgi:hypothetical protein